MRELGPEGDDLAAFDRLTQELRAALLASRAGIMVAVRDPPILKDLEARHD